MEDQTTVVAESFELLGPDGSVRGRWSCGPGGEPGFAMFDGNGRARLRLRLEPDGTTGLSFHGHDGIAVFEATFWARQGCGVEVHDPDGEKVAEVGVGTDGFPSVAVLHPSGAIAQLGTSRDGGVGLSLVDGQGQRAELGLRGDGEGHLGFLDRSGKERFVAGVSESGRGTLLVDQGESEERATSANTEANHLMGAVRRWMRRP